MEGYFELFDPTSQQEAIRSASWPPASDMPFNLPGPSTQKRDREGDNASVTTQQLTMTPGHLSVLQYDPSQEDEDEYIDPEEAGPMEEGESVLRLSGRKGQPPRKKRTTGSGQRLLSDVQVDEDGKVIGRRKIQIEFIQDKSRRHITFSKRKSGIMKKAYELSTLTGTEVLLLVVSENGTVYTYTTDKLQPIVTEPLGKGLIRECLDANLDSTQHQSSELKHGGTVSLKTRVNKKSSASSLRSPSRVEPPPPSPLSTVASQPQHHLHYAAPPSIAGTMPAYHPMPDLYGNPEMTDPNQMQHLYYQQPPELYAQQYTPTTEAHYM